MGALVVGKDNRTSTSKAIATAWTFLVAWGLFSAVVALVLGADLTWQSLQEEYLLLLGGPFAAAILAKYATSSQAESKPDGEVGESSPAAARDQRQRRHRPRRLPVRRVQRHRHGVLPQPVHRGARQRLPGLASDPDRADAHAPPAATRPKKLLAQDAARLISVVPASAVQGGTADVFGMNLTVPASASGDGEDATPIVHTGDAAAAVTTQAVVLSKDRLTITIADDAPVGLAPITVTRADGVQARDAKGVGVLAFEVSARI